MAGEPINPGNQHRPIPNNLRPQRFPTHHDAPEISPEGRIFCEVLTRVSPHGIESALTSTGVQPKPEIVQEVLKFSYNQPASAVKFFRWACQSEKQTDFAWSLMVDLLGKNQLFEPMWDCIRSMKQEGLLSMGTFVSVFGSYCAAHRFSEATMSFDVMGKYGVKSGVVAVNSLLSAICREENQMTVAMEFYDKVKAKITPDGDTFAILLEGWEKEGNMAKAKTTFGEMVIRNGWSPSNMPAYDAFLTTLVRGGQADETLKFLKVMKGNNCLPGLKFFSTALDILVNRNDSANIVSLWDMMVSCGMLPNLIMYNVVIGFLCDNNDVDNAFRIFDEMVFTGAFPDSLTYNVIFHCLVRNKKVDEVGRFFVEMVKNEFPPTHSNCAAAIEMLLGNDDPEVAIEIWNFMVENHVLPLEMSANALLVGLCNLHRLSDVRRFAVEMLDRRIVIRESTMEKLKNAFYKEGRSSRDKYDSLSKRWKAAKM